MGAVWRRRPELARRLPNGQLSIFPDGDIFQYHDVFVQQALDFLR
jgi:hypothetical protein